jgi:hypothetical protein
MKLRYRWTYAAALLQLFLFPLTGFTQTVLNGTIREVRVQEDGSVAIVIQSETGETSLIATEETLVEASIQAKRVQNGQRIALAPKSSRSGKRGFRSPFGGIPKTMRKQMGLPELPSTPDVPAGRPEGVPELPEVPKVPKVSTPKTGEGAEAVPDEPQKQRSQKVHRDEEPSEEDKSLFGRMDATKSISGAQGGPLPPAPAVLSSKEVLEVESTQDGVKLKLASGNGQSEEVVLAPDREVIQSLSIRDLRKNMTVQLEAAEAQNGLMARRITVRG